MSTLGLILLGLAAGTGAGLLAGLIGIGGGIVVVPVIYYGLAGAGATTDQAAHIAVATSLAAIMPAAVVSSLAHWRAGNTDFAFLREWGPGIVIGVIAAQFAAPHLHGNVVTGLFALFRLGVSIRFAAPNRFRPIRGEPPNGGFCHAAGVTIGLVSGFAGVGGGILTNIFMTLCGLPMHKSIGRAAATGIVVSIPATIAAALASKSEHATVIGSIDVAIWLCVAPAQAAAAWCGARLASHIPAVSLSRLMAVTLGVTGATMLYGSIV